MPGPSRRFAFSQLLVTAVLMAVVLPVGLGAHRADAEVSGGQLAGMQGTAHASGVYAFYNVGNVLPIASPVDSGAPDALTTISSGPTTFARAAVLDPGDLLASPDTLLSLFSSSYQSGTLPAYPYRIQATSGYGSPEASSAPGPGLRADVRAQGSKSTASASFGESRAPAIVTFGGVRSESSSETDGSTVTVHARTEITDINLLDALAISSVVIDVTATSSGDGVELSGGTTIGDATLMGTPVVIDRDGIQPVEGDGGGSRPLLGGSVAKSLSAQASDLLDQAGIRVTAGGTIDQAADDTGQLAATGLRIEFAFNGESTPALSSLLGLYDTLPPVELPGAPLQPADLLQIVRSSNISELQIGRAEVGLAARSSEPLPDFTSAPIDSGSVTAAPTATPTFDTGSVPQTVGPPLDVAFPVPPAVTPTIADEAPIGALSRGIGAMAVLVLLLQPLIGAWLSRLSRRVLTSATVAGGDCPNGGP